MPNRRNPPINFVRVMHPLGYTWEEFERRKGNMFSVTRWHAYYGGDIDKAWTKILNHHDMVMRFNHLKNKGWRKTVASPYNTEKTRPVKKNPVRGEWWITDDGQALYADSDVGDMGHEAYVIDSVTYRLLNAMNIDADDVGSLDNWEKNIEKRMHEDEFTGDLDAYIEDSAKTIWKDEEQRKAAIDVAWGRGDAREYSMQYDGWKRVQGHNIETWTLTKGDLQDITNGIHDAAGEDIHDDDEFNIYVFSTGVWYENVPWSVLQEDDPGKLRPFAELKRNPAPHAPVMSYAAAHRWEALAKTKGVSQVARSPRGFMRAYEKAGTWAQLDPWWKNRRNAFVARHMAQVRQNNEKLWKPDKSGKLRPSRRALALLMWAYSPPKRFQ